MNLWDWVILVVIAAAVILALRSMRGGKKSGCSGNCASCPHRCSDMNRPAKGA